jgi:hypothetical protein
MALLQIMSYQESLSYIEKVFGIFPGFLKGVPEEVEMQMWPVMKIYILGESRTPLNIEK